MSKCPHLDTILGLHEPITRRDFLEGALVGPSAALIATACPLPLRAQASATTGRQGSRGAYSRPGQPAISGPPLGSIPLSTDRGNIFPGLRTARWLLG
jgi:hypothetical protein